MAKKNVKQVHEEKLFGKYAQMSEEDIRKGGGRGPGHGPRGGGGPMGGRLFGEKPKDRKGTLIRVMKYLGSNKAYLAILLVIVFITSFISILSPVLSGLVIDKMPIKSELTLELGKDNELFVNYKAKTKKLKFSVDQDNQWIIDGTTYEVKAYEENNKEFNGYVEIINDKVLIYLDDELKAETTSIYNFNTAYKVSISDSGKWELVEFVDGNWVEPDEMVKVYAIGAKDPNEMYVALIALLVIYILSAIFNMISSIVSAKLSQSTIKKLRKDLFSNLVYLPIRYFDNHPHGDIMSRMSNDSATIANTISQSVTSLFSSVLTIIGALAVMLWYSPLLTLTCFVTLGLTLVTTKYLSKFMKKYFKLERALIGEINAQVEEMVVGHKTVKAFTKEEDIIEEFNQTSSNLKKYGFKANLYGGVMGPAMNIISNIGYLLVVVLGALCVQYGFGKGLNGQVLTIGSIITFTTLAQQFTRPINTIANLYAQIQTSLAAAERVFKTMDETHEVNEGTVKMEEIENVGDITFENVNFSYVPDEPVLKDFTLEIKPGEKIALVGATGSGKTTIVNLLMRFYDIDSGSIKIGGVDIRDIEKGSLRSQIAIVLQDTVLFKDTVGNNIKYGKLDASVEDIEAAAKMSNSSKFISRLPENYETMLTESGGNLSGGQRQLLSIARAILADPKILILDEATSSVDTRTEKNIQNALAKLMENRTNVIIAHRLSTIRDADKIVVIDHGRIVEIGRHEELLEKQGIYYNLYQTQFSGNAI